MIHSIAIYRQTILKAFFARKAHPTAAQLWKSPDSGKKLGNRSWKNAERKFETQTCLAAFQLAKQRAVCPYLAGKNVYRQSKLRR